MLDKLNLSCAKKIFGLILGVSILVTLSFIFINSALSPERSVQISDSVSNTVGTIVNTESSFGAFLKEYLRKIAHFTEFGLLGVEIALIPIVFVTDIKRKIRAGLNLLPLSFFFGFFDESIQFVSGRDARISDVWLDSFGFALCYVFSFGIYFLARFICRSVKKKY